jgi:ABC-type glycerol-3-phosphate transport system substrate-binding protein
VKTTALAVLLIAACLAGCGGEKSGGGVTLTVWETYNTEERALFLTLVQEFQAANPGVTIEPVSIPFDGLEPKILTALATNTAPDIARVDVGFLPKVALRGALAPLDEYGIETIKRDLYPVALSSCVLDGKTYGLPDQVNGLCLFYNKEMFARAGLDPEKPPVTWEEFVAAAAKITDKKAGVFGFGMRNSLWWSLPFIYSFGGEILDTATNKSTLAGDAAVAGFQFKVDLYSKYGVEGGAWRAGGIRDDMGFQSRKYAMVFNGPWAWSRAASTSAWRWCRVDRRATRPTSAATTWWSSAHPSIRARRASCWPSWPPRMCRPAGPTSSARYRSTPWRMPRWISVSTPTSRSSWSR